MAKAGTKAKPKPKNTDAKQSQRFVEAARELGVDESGKTFERAFEKIVPPKHRAAKRLNTK